MDKYIRHLIRSIAGGFIFVGLFGFLINANMASVLLAIIFGAFLLLLWAKE